MINNQNKPTIFGISIGKSFSDCFVEGFVERFSGYEQQYISNITLYVNTNKMSENIKDSFLRISPGFLPKIYNVSDLRHLAIEASLPELSNPLEEQLELNDLIKVYLEKLTAPASISSSFDLAYELIDLRNEMYSEDVSPQKIKSLSQDSASLHWQQTLKFINIIFEYWNKATSKASIESINSKVLKVLRTKWQTHPPKYPIIIAGSTGSRGTTKVLMELVAKQRVGYVVLPGYDFNQTKKVWDSFKGFENFEDHPQYRYYKLINALKLKPENVKSCNNSEPNTSLRNKFISLALRPAPVTEQWLEEGPKLRNLRSFSDGLSLIEASTLREEAGAISLCIRKAVEDNKSVSLITTDQDLKRLVKAALGRWNLIPDDSSGKSLSSSPPGIFLRQVANIFGQDLTPENLIPLLKNPLTNTGAKLRGEHLSNVREIEFKLRREGNSYVSVLEFLKNETFDEQENDKYPWIEWFSKALKDVESFKTAPLNVFVENLIMLSEDLSNGPTDKDGVLWEHNSGIMAKKVLSELISVGKNIKNISCFEFRTILTSVLNREKVRETVAAHPLIKIWGTIDARTSTTNVTILGGMNEGIWPKLPKLDPWLSRSMRKEAGLLSPERNIGLLAHDFQQGISGDEVIISRSLRINDTPAIPSRWLNRITNLLKGLGEDGANALSTIKTAGDFWIDLLKKIEAPIDMVAPSVRPSPIPPISAMPKKLSVTQIETLIRDPYSIYARHILQLKELQPLKKQATPLLKGNIIHKILLQYSEQTKNDKILSNSKVLEILIEKIFDKEVPWPAIRVIWKEQFKTIAPLFLESERIRRTQAKPLFFEHPGLIYFTEIDFSLSAIADRIDEKESNELVIYDYKSGKTPTLKQINSFHKQLLLEAIIANRGGFKNIPPKHVSLINYISMSSKHNNVLKTLSPEEIKNTENEFLNLIKCYKEEKMGFTARLRMEKVSFTSNYDHLSRYGEWDETSTPVKQILE